MITDPRSPPTQIHDIAPPGGVRIGMIPQQFNQDPSRILAALWESQVPPQVEQEFFFILCLSDVRNIVFPPFEGETRWRLAYARARGRSTDLGGSLASPVYFSASRERIAEMMRGQSVLTFNLVALGEAVGDDVLASLPTPAFALADAPRTEKAIRAQAADQFTAQRFADRPGRDWGRFLLEFLIEFYPAAAAETRLARYPWEAGTGEPAPPFLSEIRHKAVLSNHDPDDALRSALALS